MGAADNINEEQRGATHYPLVAYHGTSQENAEKIMQEGFKPANMGVRGHGVYAASDPAGAMKYARNWNDPGAVVRVVLHPNKPISTDETNRGSRMNHELPEHDVWEIEDRFWKYAEDEGHRTYVIKDLTSATPLDIVKPGEK